MTPYVPMTRITPWLEQAWLARYLDRQLSAEEDAWFEAYVLDKPELLAVIEADSALRDALAGDPAPDAGKGDDRRREGYHGRFERMRRRRLLSIYAKAAILVLGLFGGWLGTREFGSSDAAPSIIANPRRVVYDTMRGEAAPPRIEHAESSSRYILIEVAIPPGARDIVLSIPNAPAQTLMPAPDGFVTFLVDRSKMMSKAPAKLAYSVGTSRHEVALVPPSG